MAEVWEELREVLYRPDENIAPSIRRTSGCAPVRDRQTAGRVPAPSGSMPGPCLSSNATAPSRPAVLGEFFARCGWQETDAAAKLEWALAASEEWVVCKLDGELIGFGRSCRLGPMKRVVFDVLVDPRFQRQRPEARDRASAVGERRRSRGGVGVHRAGSPSPRFSAGRERRYRSGYLPKATPGTYLGRQRLLRRRGSESTDPREERGGEA